MKKLLLVLLITLVIGCEKYDNLYRYDIIPTSGELYKIEVLICGNICFLATSTKNYGTFNIYQNSFIKLTNSENETNVNVNGENILMKPYEIYYIRP